MLLWNFMNESWLKRQKKIGPRTTCTAGEDGKCKMLGSTCQFTSPPELTLSQILHVPYGTLRRC
jgi:hypothetical protein